MAAAKCLSKSKIRRFLLKAAQLVGTEAPLCATFEDGGAGVCAAHVSDALTLQVPDLKKPCDQLRALRHTIAPDLFTEAIQIGLFVNDRSPVTILLI